MDPRPPVTDWATDFDHLSDEWAAHAPEILADLRNRCPVATTERFYGAYLLSRYDDIADVARRPEEFSSRITVINENHPDNVKLELAPITLDPPYHGPLRRALLPAFNPHQSELLRPFVEGTARRLVDAIGGRTEFDAAAEFTELLPTEVVAHLYGLPPELGPQFRRWVDGIIKDGQSDIDIARNANREVQAFFAEQLQRRVEAPTDDLITMILNAEIEEPDGTRRPFTHKERIGALLVILIGGIDTTWSVLGSALMHLGTHPEDLRRLVHEPELLPSAVEEFLRYYSPVTIARVITEDTEVAGCPVAGGKRILLSYSSANRDDAQFERADQVVLDREHNRHMSFGIGIHRCLGSNLARMELLVGLRTWLETFPRFELAVPESDIQWSHGPVRGPRQVPLRLLA
jgi:cytochrome P450